MTSNQLSYWRNQEEQRANKARESETQRHNLTAEELEREKLILEEKGYRIKRAETISKLNEIYAKYGPVKASQLPSEVYNDLARDLGIQNFDKAENDNELSQIWSILGEAWEGLTKGAGNLGKLF